MEFNGEFTIEDVTVEEVWLALSDPVTIKRALPGCKFVVEVDDPDEVDFDALAEETGDEEDPPTLPEADPETVADRAFEEGCSYAALVEVSVGSVSPAFRSIGTVERRELPEMRVSGEGQASDSAFDTATGMELVDVDDGVTIEWWAEADVFGRVARMGDRAINPVTNRVVNRFFGRVEDQLTEVSDESRSFRERIREFV